jgi:hypothetical protein
MAALITAADLGIDTTSDQGLFEGGQLPPHELCHE